MAGLDPLAVLEETDPCRVAVVMALIDRRMKLAADEREDQAVRTANAVGRVLSGKK